MAKKCSHIYGTYNSGYEGYFILEDKDDLHHYLRLDGEAVDEFVYCPYCGDDLNG